MKPFPKPYAAADVEKHMKRWGEIAPAGIPPDAAPICEAIFGNSPYLSRLLLLHPSLLDDFLKQGADKTLSGLMSVLHAIDIHQIGQAELMKQLRLLKGQIALLTAIADISESWPLEKTTYALSAFADASVETVLDFLLAAAHKRKEITLNGDKSGIIVLGMGKLGAFELNYSSDIDLIIFFEPGILQYVGRQNEQHFMNRLAHDLVDIMQSRTADGYVFRTDLRLRPDPASTPPAVSVNAAYHYYESVGQNWERAAMIKARPVAGDKQAGETFLKNLQPYMWRRHLDFAAINDIHSIKRQMDRRKGQQIKVAGHNIKIGIGGIREIEFYTQIHQLIWGGREASLRTRPTCETLSTLCSIGLIDAKTRDTMTGRYYFLRKLEHRLQMIADEQTHSMPISAEGIAHVACFMGYASAEEFSAELLGHLAAVHGIYASSFKGAESLGNEGSLVFTGVSHDPDTLETLSDMGYENPETVSEIVMGWHHGSCRATRTKRARELLTELMPTLLKRLSETANPDAAFLKFHSFLTKLPAGIQLFSLFSTQPKMLGLIADIMGSAPTLADQLSKSPSLLDVVLFTDFYDAFPAPGQLQEQLRALLASFNDFESRMNTLRRFRNEKQFQIGIHLLKHMINTTQASLFLSQLADVLLEEAFCAVNTEFTQTYGHIPGGSFGVIALGKLGSREMTFSSDIDLVFVYDAPDSEAVSDGEKGFTASVYYNRLAQRFTNALSTMGNDGRLYEVDTRLRPSGTQGLLAVSMKGLEHYFGELAWTFEYMAFSKARTIIAPPELQMQLDDFIIAQLKKPRDAEKLRHDVTDMRGRIEKEFPGDNPWDLKYARGGLIDLDFIAQYLLLKHAHSMVDAAPGSAATLLRRMSAHIAKSEAEMLLGAYDFLTHLFNMLRLTSGDAFDKNTALPGLKKLLCDSLRVKDFETLEATLIKVERQVYEFYSELLTPT